MTRAFRSMARNNAWANETLYGVFAALVPGDFTVPAPGFFPSLAATMNHILLVDRYYIAALEGAPVLHSEIAAPDITEPQALYAAQEAQDRRFIAFCDALTEEALTDTRMTIRDAGPVDETIEALLLHLFQHQVHHRGQAHVQLQSLGVDPPQLDDFHLVFGRVKSAARWQS